MGQDVTLPLWLFILIVLFAAVTFASHFLFPSVRWFFRKRAERIIARLNTRLQRPIEPFKLAERYDTIQRVIYDPEVLQAVTDYAREEGVPENVAFEKAKDYAREIVPSFSATAYFTFGMRAARWLSNYLYHIRIGAFDRAALEEIDPDATIIFVMNHRSNMDYVLVTYLVSQASAMSYAVGEWARVWPLSAMIRAMGAYFIRRKDRDPLYRKVLARYVQISTSNGVTQAFFPEGGLSLTGRVMAPKKGILSYILSGHRPEGRDVIFVPVGVNYDRVLEDEVLIAAQKKGERRFRAPYGRIALAAVWHLWRKLTGKFRKFGAAGVGFGTPLSLSQFMASKPRAPTDALAAELVKRIRAVVPVLPVPLVARIVQENGPIAQADIIACGEGMIAQYRAEGRKLADLNAPDMVRDGLEVLRRRGLVMASSELIAVAQGMEGIVGYYAQSLPALGAVETETKSSGH